MMTTVAKMAFHLKDLGWRGSGDAVVIVVLVIMVPYQVFLWQIFCLSTSKRSEEMEDERREATYLTGVHS